MELLEYADFFKKRNGTLVWMWFILTIVDVLTGLSKAYYLKKTKKEEMTSNRMKTGFFLKYITSGALFSVCLFLDTTLIPDIFIIFNNTDNQILQFLHNFGKTPSTTFIFYAISFNEIFSIFENLNAMNSKITLYITKIFLKFKNKKIKEFEEKFLNELEE